jgi:hypothetical protein
MTFNDREISLIRDAILYASRFTHEEILQRGEADEEYDLQAAIAGEKLAQALNILDNAERPFPRTIGISQTSRL